MACLHQQALQLLWVIIIFFHISHFSDDNQQLKKYTESLGSQLNIFLELGK